MKTIRYIDDYDESIKYVKTKLQKAKQAKTKSKKLKKCIRIAENKLNDIKREKQENGYLSEKNKRNLSLLLIVARAILFMITEGKDLIVFILGILMLFR